MFDRISSALKMQVLSRQAVEGDYETANEVVAVRASKELTIQAEELLDTTLGSVESGLDQQTTISAIKASNPPREVVDLALGLLRLSYFPFELREANTAWRYLVAVKHDTNVTPLRREEENYIERMEQFASLASETAFGQIAVLEPRLRDAEEYVREHSKDWDGSSADRDGFLQIDRTLEALVGPGSNGSDPLLGSGYARLVARNHLISVGELLGD